MDNGVDDQMRLGDLDVLLEMQQRQLQLGKLFLCHRNAYRTSIRSKPSTTNKQ